MFSSSHRPPPSPSVTGIAVWESREGRARAAAQRPGHLRALPGPTHALLGLSRGTSRALMLAHKLSPFAMSSWHSADNEGDQTKNHHLPPGSTFLQCERTCQNDEGLSPTTENQEPALSSFPRKEDEEEQRKALIINSYRGALKFISKYLKQLFASSSKIIVDVSVLASTSLKRKDFF